MGNCDIGRMRSLWPIELAVLIALAELHSGNADQLRNQIASAKVVSFRNTGAGFYSYLLIDAHAHPFGEESPVGGIFIEVNCLENGMNFLIFLKDGIAETLEGFSLTDSTENIDFEQATYTLLSSSSDHVGPIWI